MVFYLFWLRYLIIFSLPEFVFKITRKKDYYEKHWKI